jgi:hypothetical protein
VHEPVQDGGGHHGISEHLVPLDPEAASLFFALISSCNERGSMIVSSNKNFSAWAEIFGDPVAVAAMTDRLVHHAESSCCEATATGSRGRERSDGAAQGLLSAQVSTGAGRAVFDRR